MREVYVALGRGEMRAGRSLDALQSAYRVGARIAWERFVEAADTAGHEPAVIYRLGSAIFAYIDGISAESIEGFAEEQSAEAGERQRRRRALVRLLARDDAAEEGSATWRRSPPGRCRRRSPRWWSPRPTAPSSRSGLGGDVIAEGEGDVTTAFLPDPDAPGRRAQLESVARRDPPRPRAHGAAGPRPHSLARARALHRLVLDGRLAADGLVLADEHLPELLLHGGDRGLAGDLAARALEPLGELTPDARAKLVRRCACGSTTPGRSSASRRCSTSTPRRCATGWRACGSCSATRSRTPTAASSSR